MGVKIIIKLLFETNMKYLFYMFNINFLVAGMNHVITLSR